VGASPGRAANRYPHGVSPDPRRRRVALAIVVVVAVFGLARIGAARSELWWNSAEQHYYGLIPHHLVGGLAGPAVEYLPEAHQGCALIWGLACAPVVAASGPTRGSLRLCNLGWHVAMLVIFCLLAAEVGGVGGVLATGVLWTLAPPAVADASHFGWVTHVDAGLLTGLAALCLLRSQRADARPQWAGVAGLLGGLAVWFLFDAALVVAGIGAAWLASRPGARTIRWSAVGAVVGLSPHLVTGGWWQHPTARDELGLPLGEVPERLWTLLSSDLVTVWGLPGRSAPDAPWLETAGPAALLLGVGWGLGLAAGIALLRRPHNQSLPLRLAGGAVLVHLAGCAFSGLDLSHGRYLLPMWPWIALLAAGGAGWAFQHGSTTARASAALGLVLAGGVGASAGGAGALARGLGLGDPPAAHAAWAQGRSGHVLTEHTFATEYLVTRPPDEIWALAERFPRDSSDLARIAGEAAVRRGEADGADLAYPPWLPAAARHDFAEGAGQRVGHLAARTPYGGAIRFENSIAYRVGRLRGRHLSQFQEEGWSALTVEAAPESDRLLECAALGAWSMPLMWTTEPIREPIPACEAAPFAAGLGVGLARAMIGGGRTPDEVPRLEWWVDPTEAADAVQAEFACGFATERSRLERLSEGRGEGDSPWEVCFPRIGAPSTEEAPDPEPPPTLPRPE